MKDFRRNTRGQFVVIAALLIAILTLSVALSIHQINLHRQQLRYEPVEELVLGITSDLDRCLIHSLSMATQLYHSNMSLGTDPATREGTDFIFKWVRSIHASYAHLGINVTLSVPQNMSEGGPTYVEWRIDWSNPTGISYVSTKFDLDIDAYGYKGWVGRSAKFVTLRILDVQNNTVQFRIRQGTLSDSLPVPNLTSESLYKTRIHIADDFWASYPELQVTDLTYLGDGVYRASFNHAVNQYTHGAELTISTPEDNIIVSALYYRNVQFFINLQSQEQNSASPTNEGRIEFDGENYTLPVYSLSTNPGKHRVKYFANGTADAFLNWTTTENIDASNPTYYESDIEINGNGTVTAFYMRIKPVIVTLTLDSVDWQNLTQHLGTITLGSTTYILPAENINTTTGEYPLSYNPPDPSHEFVKWLSDPKGVIIPAYSLANPTTLKVLGNGTITAVYRHKPTLPTLVTVKLESREDSNATQNLGKIQLAENNYTLYPDGNTVIVFSDAYWLEYFPENEGYTFLNWTTTGDITVTDNFSRGTIVFINGNGTIIAFYTRYVPPEHEILELKMDSREEGNETLTHLGLIVFNSTSYNLPNATNLTAGNYALEYKLNNSSYFFLKWEWVGDVKPLESNKNSTMLNVFGNGTIIAVYSSSPPTTKLCDVTLQSQEENSLIPANKGFIQLGATLFNLPNSTSIANGTYLLAYTPAEGYTFLYWVTTGEIALQDNSTSTMAIINGDGTITAVYRGCNLRLDSRDWQNLTQHLGTITLGSTTYALPNCVMGLTAGDYTVQYTPQSSDHIFLMWESSGDVFPINSTSSITRLKIFGDGNLTAVYYVKPSAPALATVVLRSLEETLAPPGNLGKMQLGETIFGLPNSTTLTTGEYLLEYLPKEGYTFLNWTTTGDISVINPYSPSTTVMINGNGSITAFYRGCKINLDSRQWDNSSFNLGSITLGANTYTLPKNLTGVAGGEYLLQYKPENSSYQFLWWSWTGSVIPENCTSATTTLTIYGDGNVTAVYSLIYQPPPSPSEEWKTLYLCDLPPSMLLPYSMLPKHYFNPRSSTLPIPPRPYWQIIDVCTPPTLSDMTIAKYVNISLYIQLASGKAENITIELKFTYDNTTYLIGSRTFYNLTGEAWYTHTIDTDRIDKTDWPVPGEPIIPEGSLIILTVIVPPNSGTLHIVYGWDRYQSYVDLF